MYILIEGATVLPMTAGASESQKYYTGDVAVAQGRILFAGPTEEVAAHKAQFISEHGSVLKRVDGAGKVVMPGLINLHNHVAMTLLRGYADDLPLMSWLEEKIWPFEWQLSPEDVHLGAQLGISEMLLGGTTTFVDMYWHTEETIRAAQELGIRGVICPTFVEANYEKFESLAIGLLEDLTLKADPRIDIRIAPHAPYTCPPEVIRRALKLCERYGVGIHTHLSETADEQRIIRERYDTTPTQYLYDQGVFDYPTLAAHCVYLNEADMDILLQKGVSVVHNPHSNLKLASGIAPVARMLERGLNVGIGTDGPASNNALDLWEEMRSASLLQKGTTGDPCVLPAYEVLQMATVHGARALGREGELGVVKPGARADLLLVDIRRPHLTPTHDLVANLVYSAKAADVQSVIVEGRLVVEHRVVQGVDLDQLYDRVQHRVEQIAAKL